MSPNKEVFTAIVKSDAAYEFSNQCEEVCSQVYEYAQTNPTQQMEKTANTLFGAYNAITGYYQNVKSYKTEDAKVNSIMFGTALTVQKQPLKFVIRQMIF
jgi:hypothetical protein